jgi:hypothetical protein
MIAITNEKCIGCGANADALYRIDIMKVYLCERCASFLSAEEVQE